MPIQHKHKFRHLVLAVALAVGSVEISLAEQVESQIAEVKPKKPRKPPGKPPAPMQVEEISTEAQANSLPETIPDHPQTPLAPSHK